MNCKITNNHPPLFRLDTPNEAQTRLIAVANELFDHLINTHKDLVIQSVVELFNRYFDWIDGIETTGKRLIYTHIHCVVLINILSVEAQPFLLGYILTLPKAVPNLVLGKK